MNTYEWAKNELKLARENEIAKCKKDPDYEPGDEDYGLMCYDAAEQLLDLFEEQGHSGYSARIVCSIFERLVKGKPLTPITDEDDQWGERYTAEEDPVKRYQHKRMSSLFKNVDADGAVTYRDNDRVRAYALNHDSFSTRHVDANGDVSYCDSLNNHVKVYDPNNGSFSTRHIDDIVDEYFPIKFPYTGDTIKVRVNDFDNIESENGRVDVRHIIDATKNDIEHVYIDRYFMRTNVWHEIDVFAYRDIIKSSVANKKEETDNG